MTAYLSSRYGIQHMFQTAQRAGFARGHQPAPAPTSGANPVAEADELPCDRSCAMVTERQLTAGARNPGAVPATWEASLSGVCEGVFGAVVEVEHAVEGDQAEHRADLC